MEKEESDGRGTYSRPVGRGRPLARARDSAVSLRFAVFLYVLLRFAGFSLVFYRFSESVFLQTVSLDKRLTVIPGGLLAVAWRSWSCFRS